MKNWIEGIGVGTIVFGGVSLLLLVSPLINFIMGWVVGFVLMLFVGGYLSEGLNLIFETARFSKGQLPMICATLAVVGSFFKSTQTNKKE